MAKRVTSKHRFLKAYSRVIKDKSYAFRYMYEVYSTFLFFFFFFFFFYQWRLSRIVETYHRELNTIRGDLCLKL